MIYIFHVGEDGIKTEYNVMLEFLSQGEAGEDSLKINSHQNNGPLFQNNFLETRRG